MSGPDLSGILGWLQERQRFGLRLGLERMAALLATLDRPHSRFRSVLIGGTNGKGSTAAVLAAALAAQGERVGLTTSPHLQRLAERVVVAGAPVDDDELAAALARLRGPAERVGATYFEIVTAAALLLFAQARVDTAVLEVGLGGRFDATNAVEPVLSVITGVALDHVDVLGDTLAQIAHEKAGILRPGVTAWTGAEGEGLALLRQEARTRGARLRALASHVDLTLEGRGWDGLELRVAGPWGVTVARTPLVGRHQARNVALALAAAAELGVPPEVAARGAAAARWPGRLERFEVRGRWLVLDGAHNPEAARALAAALRELEGRVAVLVLGISADKDVRTVAAALTGMAERVIATRAASSPRALAPRELAPIIDADATAEQPSDALELALRWAVPGETVVVAGSLFLVGEVRALLLGAPLESGERWQ